MTGILDVGRYPSGADDVPARPSQRTCRASTFVSVPRPDIMRWKYRKLIMNLYNALEALLGPGTWPEELTSAIRREGEAGASPPRGSTWCPRKRTESAAATCSRSPRSRARRRGGGSSWQSLARGLGTIETDYLNGEIVLLGRLHGIPTPANALVQRMAAQAARSKAAPGQHVRRGPSGAARVGLPVRSRGARNGRHIPGSRRTHTGRVAARPAACGRAGGSRRSSTATASGPCP